MTSGNLSGVANNMVFFIPNLTNIQPFVDYHCLVNPGNSDCDITVRARGNCGGEQMQLWLDGEAVQTWTVTTSLTNYTYSGFMDGQQVQVAFINDGNVAGCDYNLKVDDIRINGTTYETEDVAVRTGCGSSE